MPAKKYWLVLSLTLDLLSKPLGTCSLLRDALYKDASSSLGNVTVLPNS